MTLSRRDVLALAAAVSIPHWVFAAEEPRRKKLLILGGTRFLGPALVEAALAGGWELTLFNRGKSNPGLFKGRTGIEEIQGDRNTDDVKKLADGKWDAVIDTSGYFPRQIRATTAVLAGKVSRYVFISSESAYKLPMKPGSDETAEVARLPVGTDVDKIDKITEENFGALKQLCAEEAEKAFPRKTLDIRPGYIVGQRDGSDRFTYWPVRVERGGEVIVPGRPRDLIQFIDVRDLGDWIIRLVEKGATGSFNATGPKEKLRMDAFLEACRKATGSKATFVWIDEKTLEGLGLKVGEEFPIWTSPTGTEAGLEDVSIAKALKAGLTFRPLDSTIKETLAYWKSLPEERRAKMRAGLAPEREAEALKAFHAKKA
jgi:2'-hydroxyisoflavone reductase